MVPPPGFVFQRAWVGFERLGDRLPCLGQGHERASVTVAQRSLNSWVWVSLSLERRLAVDFGGSLGGWRGFGICMIVVGSRGEVR